MELDGIIMRAAEKSGYSSLHQNQQKGVKSFLQGNDVFISLPTGSVSDGSSHAQKAKRRQRREREMNQQSGGGGGDPRLDSRKLKNTFPLERPSLQNQHLLPHGREEDHRSSTSTLSNILEQERPTSSPIPPPFPARVGERTSHGISTPPPSNRGGGGGDRPQHLNSSSFVHQEAAVPMEACTRYSDYSQDLEYHRHLSLSTGPRDGPSSHSHHVHPSTYGDAFNLSSQSALQSQSFPPSMTMSQQRPTTQDRLSMDVLQHTQPSSTPLSGAGAVLAKIKAVSGGGKDTSHFLLSSDLKGLEMDDIELEKQRIHLLLYEEKKEKELSLASKEKELQEEEGEVSIEELKLQKELMSIENLITEQKKKLKDLKYNREREEKKLREVERQLHDTIVEAALLDGDQQRQLKQRQRQQELEGKRRELTRRIQTLMGSEHNAKTKLMAYEYNAGEIRDQLGQLKEGSPKGDGGGCLPQNNTLPNGVTVLLHRQDNEFSEKSDVPRPGSPLAMREGMPIKLTNFDTASEVAPPPPSSGIPPQEASNYVGKTVSVSDLDECAGDGGGDLMWPAKWSSACDNQRSSDQYSNKSHSRDEVDVISKGRNSDERPYSLEGMFAPPPGDTHNPPPQSMRGEGRHHRGHESYEGGVMVGRNSSSLWYQANMQRPPSTDSRSDSSSTCNWPDRPDQGPPSSYNRSDQMLPSTAYNRPDQSPSSTYSRFELGPPGAAPSRAIASQQVSSGYQSRVEPSSIASSARSDLGLPAVGSRPGSAFSDHKPDLEPGGRAITLPPSGRTDASGKGHHYSRQTKSRASPRSLNQSNSSDNLIAANGEVSSPGTPDVVPSIRTSGSLPFSRPSEGSSYYQPEQPVRERSTVATHSEGPSLWNQHSGKQEPPPATALGGDRTKATTFGGVAGRPAHPSSYEQVLPQQGGGGRAPHNQVPATTLGRHHGGQLVAPLGGWLGEAASPHQRQPREPGRSYSEGQGQQHQGRSCEPHGAVQQGQGWGKPCGVQGWPNDPKVQGRSCDQGPMPQGRSYGQGCPSPVGRSSYEHVVLAQGRSEVLQTQGRSYDQGRLSYEHAVPVQGRSHDITSLPQGRPYDQGKSYEPAATVQVRSHDITSLPQGRPYDSPVGAPQRRPYEQFTLLQGKPPQEQGWTAQVPMSGRPSESMTLPPASHLQGQRTTPYERTFAGGELSSVGKAPIGYPTKVGSHSYSRRRPDPPQQMTMTLEDKMKHYMEGMEEPVSYPDRILQRQQTEL